MDAVFKLNGEQIEQIINRVVPLIAAPDDQEFFRGVLHIYAEEHSSGQVAYFINQLLKTAGQNA